VTPATGDGRGEIARVLSVRSTVPLQRPETAACNRSALRRGDRVPGRCLLLAPLARNEHSRNPATRPVLLTLSHSRNSSNINILELQEAWLRARSRSRDSSLLRVAARVPGRRGIAANSDRTRRRPCDDVRAARPHDRPRHGVVYSSPRSSGGVGAVGVAWGFWPFGIGAVAGISSARLLAKQIRPPDPDLLHDAMNADPF